MGKRTDFCIHAMGCPRNKHGDLVFSKLPCGMRSYDGKAISDNYHQVTCVGCLRWMVAEAFAEMEHAINIRESRIMALTLAAENAEVLGVRS